MKLRLCPTYPIAVIMLLPLLLPVAALPALLPLPLLLLLLSAAVEALALLPWLLPLLLLSAACWASSDGDTEGETPPSSCFWC